MRYVFFTKHRRLLPYIVHLLPIFTFIEKTQTALDTSFYKCMNIHIKWTEQGKNNVFTNMQVPPCWQINGHTSLYNNPWRVQKRTLFTINTQSVRTQLSGYYLDPTSLSRITRQFIMPLRHSYIFPFWRCCSTLRQTLLTVALPYMRILLPLLFPNL